MSIYLNDNDIAERLGVDSVKWESVAVVLERSGLPRRDPLFDEKRCWPAVLEFLLRRAGVHQPFQDLVKRLVHQIT